MFVGHYGVSFAAKELDKTIPLWLLFIAVQWLDVVWAPLVLLGVERVRIVPGITASNPLDLYYMPYVGPCRCPCGACRIRRLRACHSFLGATPMCRTRVAYRASRLAGW
jgi:hypothetical protein